MKNEKPLMDTDGHGLVNEAETRKIIGCAMTVINTLGHGFLEKPYENALCIEFRLHGVSFRQQPRYEIRYKSIVVGEYIPDLVVFDSIIVDTKTVEKIGNVEKGQMINYLRISGLKVGLIINFKHPRLEWERVVL